MKYIVRGVIGAHGANYALTGQFTYLTEQVEGWWSWDGEHKARKFTTRLEALEAVDKAHGPLFRMPSPETVEVLAVE